MKNSISFLILLFACSITSSFSQIIKIEQATNYDAVSLQKLNTAVRLLDSILATDTFRRRVLDAKFVGTKGKTNLEIYNYLMSGNSEYDDSNDKVINLFLNEYDAYAGGGEFGMTKGKITSTHRCYILQNDTGCLVAHLLHEYLHVMGFSHRRRPSEMPKKRTVPYLIGTIIKEMLASSVCVAVNGTCRNK